MVLSDWSDIICNPLPLVEDCPKTWFFIEVTMNHPETKRFMNLLSHRQKERYSILFDNMVKGLSKIDPDRLTVKYNNYIFESCKSGKQHLHGIIIMRVTKLCNIEGLLSDIAKLYLMQLVKPYNVFKASYVDKRYNKIKSPSICLTYNYEEERLQEWLDYLTKESYNYKYNDHFIDVMKLYKKYV